MSDTPNEELPPKGPVLFVHNTSRSRHNRAQRFASPEHGGHKQYIGGEHRLIRGRPLAMHPELLEKHLPELRAKAAQGLIDVKDANGRSIDLETMEYKPGAPPPQVDSPRPHPLLDSIQRDKPAGVHMPQMAGGYSETSAPGVDGATIPDLVAAAPSEKEEEDGSDAPIVPHGGTQPRGGKKKGGR